MAATLEIILVRHAKAADRDPVEYPDDSLRRLTDKGREKMREAAIGLSRILADVDVIITSPYARAAETAEILVPVFTPKRALETCKDLCPGGSTANLLAYLKKFPDCRRIMLVGHETDLSSLAAELIGAEDSDGFEMKKGGCCLIRFANQVEPGEGLLLWWLTPAILRALG